MAKNWLKLLFQATFACCLVSGVLASGVSFNSGFEATLVGESSLAASPTTDSDAPETWLHSTILFIPYFIWAFLFVAGLVTCTLNTIFELQPIRAPPAKP